MKNAHFQRGSLLFQQGRYKEAVGELKLQLGQGAEDAATHSLLAQALAELDEFAAATEHAQRAIHVAPDDSDGHFALARVMLGRKRLDEAREAISEAIRLDPYQPTYFGILAFTHLGQSRWREALAAANQGLEIDPEHSLCTNLRAQSLVKLGDRSAAATTMGEALSRRPDDPYTHANQGWALLHGGQPRQALDHFREALRIDPELDWARAGIVEALKARNFVYRWMLAWFLWMSRLTPQMRWGLVIGAFIGQQIIRDQAARHPQLAPVLWPILYTYFAFVLLTWLSYSLFNLLLRLDRYGRYSLSADQVRGANVLAICLIAILALLARSVAARFGLLGPNALRQVALLDQATLMAALVALPASAIYMCDTGWPRQSMALITIGLATVVAFFAIVVSFPLESVSPLILFPLARLAPILPFALIASQLAANYLVGVTVKK